MGSVSPFAKALMIGVLWRAWNWRICPLSLCDIVLIARKLPFCSVWCSEVSSADKLPTPRISLNRVMHFAQDPHFGDSGFSTSEHVHSHRLSKRIKLSVFCPFRCSIEKLNADNVSVSEQFKISALLDETRKTSQDKRSPKVDPKINASSKYMR